MSVALVLLKKNFPLCLLYHLQWKISFVLFSETIFLGFPSPHQYKASFRVTKLLIASRLYIAPEAL